MSYFQRKKSLLPVLILIGVMGSSFLFAQGRGEELFKSICAACHTIGKGRLVGPDLANIQNRRSEEWIIKFVQSSQTLINSGDADAVAIYKEYNEILMPDRPDLSDDDVKAIISYMVSGSVELTEIQSPEEELAEVVVQETGEVVEQETEQDIEKPKEEKAGEGFIIGQDLFVGITRFENRGPSCNSCHHVKNDAIMAGGLLAKDLTTAYTRLTEAGLKAIIKNSPFPAMKEAYKNKPLTEEEVNQLSAFLQFADKEHIYQHDRDYGKYLLYGGFGGVICLLGLFYMIWFNRKKKPVNYEVFDRQVRSV